MITRDNNEINKFYESFASINETTGTCNSIGETKQERKSIDHKTYEYKRNGNTYLEYELMLMETHGCSAYHYHRHQNFNTPGIKEAEF